MKNDDIDRAAVEAAIKWAQQWLNYFDMPSDAATHTQALLTAARAYLNGAKGVPSAEPMHSLTSDEQAMLTRALFNGAKVVAPAAPAQPEQGSALAVVNMQAGDNGLWFVAETITEGYLQAALRHLHEAVEHDAALRSTASSNDKGINE